jgi:acetyltransferase
VEVEGLKDISFGLAPLTFQEADEMLEKTWAGRKLRGYRSLPPADRTAALQALLRIARLAADFPQIAEVEVNPLRVLPAGQGVYALDIRVILKV